MMSRVVLRAMMVVASVLGCVEGWACAPIVSARVNLLKPDTIDIQIFNGFSPNGDGVNDTFVIQGIENYSDNTLQVFNRWGNLVFEREQYDNTWDGTWNGESLTDGTYFYVLRVTDPVNNKEERLSGAVTLFRGSGK